MAVAGVITTELETKRTIIKRESINVANAIRTIKIGNPKCRLQLERMASDFILDLSYAAYNLNIVVPSITTAETYKLLADACSKITVICSDLQQAKYEDYEELKEKLALSLEQIKTGVEWFEKEFKVPNQFVGNQLRRQNHIIIFSIYKLKYQADFFDNTNMELVSEINTGLVKFIKTMKSITTTGKVAEDAFRRAFCNLSFITRKAVEKLENWIEINQDHPDNVKLIRKVSVMLSDLYGQQIRIANKDIQNVSYLNSELINIFEAGTKEQRKLTELKFADSLGGQEFIRSILFDTITFAGVYSENMKIVIEKH